MSLNWNFNNSYLNLPKDFYSYVKAEKFSNPKIVIFNDELAKNLNLNIKNIIKDELSLIFSGQISETNNRFYSQAYAGHQFGYLTILGDGRALCLGEHINNNNERFDIQLKGSGKTPYSRNGDGKATLGSMLREYIISEAMHYLGIKTTRSLSVVLTGENILREKYFKGAILTRVAKSHIRFGTFEFANLFKDKKYIKELTDYSIRRHFPEITNKNNRIELFLEKIMDNQIDLIVDWMRVGFIHGVMNTDNMSIIGETIDYGPCAFMDEYNPKTVFSSIDQFGRYNFENQSKIALWNLARFAETLILLFDKDENIAIKKIENILDYYFKKFKIKWLKMMKMKIGLIKENKKDEFLINELLNIMHIFKLDYTNTFIELQNNQLNKYDFFKEWLEKYNLRLKLELKKNNLELINKINPEIIPRNHIVEKILNQAENNDYYELIKFMKILKDPYNYKILNEFRKPPNEKEKVLKTFCGT